MSSDKVSTCPKCFKKALKSYQKKVDDLKKSYGKISQKKFLEKTEALPMKPADGMFSTLCQYHDIGISIEGTLTINISASCDVCGFRCSYEHSEKVYKE